MVVRPDLDEALKKLQDWLKTQPHLPQKIEPEILKRFLHSMFGDVEGAKRLFELNYALRNKHPQIFLERDPLDEKSQKLLQVADLIPLPGLTPEKNKLLLYRLCDSDADKFNFTEGVKAFFMVADCRFAVPDEDGNPEGEIPIFDMAGFTMRHLAKTVFSSLRVYMKFVQEAHPVRLRGVHVLNCPSYLDKVLTVVKPFIKSEVFKLIHFHLPNSDTPYKFFPQEMLPTEYGGKAGDVKDMKEKWMKILKEQRNYLMDENRWKIDKSKKNGPEADMTRINQNFKALDID